jgi:glutamyl aminopeptidase
MNKKLFQELCDAPAIAGNESRVRAIMRRELSKTSDSILTDNLGGIFGVKQGPKGSPVIMIAGHMDEVGAMVVGIKDNGLLKIKAIGGLDGAVYQSQHMNVYPDNGHVIPGVTVTMPPHLLRDGDQKQPSTKFDDLLIDVGASSKKDVLKLGIQIGDMIVSSNEFKLTADKKKIISKAIDNRWGCYMVLELMRELQGVTVPCTIIAGANVQEEVGLRGAVVSANMVKPDVFIALDASPAGDRYPGDQFGALGEGFLLRILDKVTVMHQGMKVVMKELATNHKLPYQEFYSAGGTDAGAAQYAGSGVAVATIGLPARYIHSTTSMMQVRDSDVAFQLLKHFVLALDQTQLMKIQSLV